MSTQDIVQEFIDLGAVRYAREMLSRQLRARFGALSTEVENRIREASAKELDRWLERVVVVERADDIFKE